MARVPVIISLALVAGIATFTVPGEAFAPQVRDVQAPNQPTERQIPIGTASISGTVTAADTGRPIRGANVNINATIGTPPTSGPLAGNAPGTLGRGRAVGAPVAFVSRQDVTDASGRFTLDRLPAGSYNINVNRQQFLNTQYGQRKPGGQGTPITVGDGQNVNVTIPLTRGGAIAGTIYGEDGTPLQQVQVMAWRAVMTNGIKRLQQTNGGQTDDRGMYRLFGLQPGDYYLSATPNANESINLDRVQSEKDAISRAIASGAIQPPAGPGMPSTVSIPVQNVQALFQPGVQPGYLPTFAPHANVPSSATPVHVAGGDEHTNVDVQVQLIAATQITGTITTPLDDGVGVQISLMSDGDSSFDVGSLPSARATPDGKFTLRNVSPGKYIVFAQTVVAPQRGIVVTPQLAVGRAAGQAPPRLTDAQHLWARASIDVTGQPTLDVSLALKPGKAISGNVVFAYTTDAPPNLAQQHLTVTLQPAPSAQPFQVGPLSQAQVGPDGRFTLNGVVAGKYSMRVNAGVMKSAMVNGQDSLDFPFDFTGEFDVSGATLTVTDASTQVSGRIMDAGGKPALDYTIIFASSDERFWTPGSRRIQITRADSTGVYTLRNMPAGTYLLGAVTDLEPGGQFDPELLKSLRAASRTVVVADNEKIVQDLRVK